MKTFAFPVIAALVAAPLSPLAAQDMADALAAATKMEKLDVSTPLDAKLTCAQVQAEIGLRDQEMMMVAMRMTKVADNQMKEQMTDYQSEIASNKMSVALNAIAPGLGTALDAAADAARKVREKTREARLVADAGSIASRINFASQRMQYLHELMAKKNCA